MPLAVTQLLHSNYGSKTFNHDPKSTVQTPLLITLNLFKIMHL